MTLGLPDGKQAATELSRLVRRTPVLRVPSLDARARTALWLNAENLQHVGAFKARGALLNALRMSAASRRKGLLTYSSGNHAQAVAYAARHFGVRADIVMPEDAPRVKVEAVRAMGAHIVFAGTTSEERKKEALRIRDERDAQLIEPFDHPSTICGQGTATLELIEQAEIEGVTLDAIVVPVGGGGLSAGAALATEGTDIALHTVEPGTANALAQSLRAGELVAVPPGPTLADGLKPTRIGVLNFAILERRVRSAHTVDDADLKDALVAALLNAKMLLEPSGAAALAVALKGNLPPHYKNVGILCSGGNVDPAVVAALLTESR